MGGLTNNNDLRIVMGDPGHWLNLNMKKSLFEVRSI